MISVTQQHRVRPRGFTLVEMVLSITILALIFGVCIAVVTLSARSRGTESATDHTSQAVVLRKAIDQIAAELRSATSIVVRSANLISFYVPDRDGDGDPEWISYYKFGTDLMRSYNSIIPTTFVEDIGAINFTYLDKTSTSRTPVEGAEQLLMSYTTTPNALTTLSTTSWECQYFNPSAIMPANAVSWKITRVQFLLKKANGSATGNVNVRIQPAATNLKPATGSMTTGTVAVSTMSTTNAWVEIPLTSPVAELSPGQGVTLVVTSDKLITNATINGVISISPATVNMAECSTTNAGSTWTTPTATACLNYKVYGTITTLP